MKKFLVLIVTSILILNVFAGCTKKEETTSDNGDEKVFENSVQEKFDIAQSVWMFDTVTDPNTGELIDSSECYPYISKLTFFEGGTVSCVIRKEVGSDAVTWNWEPIENTDDNYIQYVIVNSNGNYINVAYNINTEKVMLVGWGDYTYWYK
ncbi:MAG: hypothetical protein IKT46_02275 [Clostridia bacterium]|nr:hypothetical protein [Clostridia bacterium]